MLVMQKIDGGFTVCKLPFDAKIDLKRAFTFVSRTDSELSVVIPSKLTPKDTLAREDGWKGFRAMGQMDFTLVGVLSQLCQLLADNRIALFAVSTFDTDYIFVKFVYYEDAAVLFRDRGWLVP